MFPKRQAVKHAQAVARDVEGRLADAESMLRDASAEMGSRASDLFGQAQDALRAAMELVQGLGDDIADDARARRRAASVYVDDHPWHIVGAAAAVGVLLGVLLSRR